MDDLHVMEVDVLVVVMNPWLIVPFACCVLVVARVIDASRMCKMP